MNTSYEKFSFYNNYFGGYIDGDNIYSADFYGNKQVIGVTMKKHQETLDLLNTYYNKLIDLGIIEKEKTPEDIAKEQQQMMQSMIAQMKSMQEKLDNLQNQNEIEKDINNEYKSSGTDNKSENESESRPTKSTNKVNR